jgi:Tfp pilus assembly protein PilF
MIWLPALAFFGCQTKTLTTAKIHIQQNDWEQAVAQLEKAVAENPQNAEAQFLLGRGYAEQGRFAEMSRAFAASLKASLQLEAEIKSWQEKYFAEQFNLGVKAAGENDFPTAREAFTAALTIDPMHPEAYRNLAYVHGKLEEPEKALKYYRTLLELKPDDGEAYLAMAGIHNQRGEYDQSAAILEQALAKNPKQSRLWAELAIIYDCTGQSDKAFAAYKQALQIRPDDKELLLNFGQFYISKEDYANAIQEFAKILSFDPDHFEANYGIGVNYLKIGEALQKQTRHLDGSASAASISVSRTDSLQSTAAIKNFKAALPFLLKAVKLDTLHAGAYFNLGFAYVRLGESEKAKEAFKKSEELQEKR